LLAGTKKIPPLSPATPPPPRAERPPAPEPPPQQPVLRPTRPVEKKRDTAEVAIVDSPGATMMMEWNGLLLCTSGPLEGQRFIIEDQGFYIGRDSTLSQVVVADSRISKRHVQIVPRNGKVWAVDQSSTNGTYLARARDERIKEVQLSRGDEIILADDAATFRYQV
ncbi:MAG TPA: FHA domain-containing protein, partial [Thermoanaerobaculia bacterium]|nr:FHA domain-containing protein [Thermoanaerobaculia bacterium]